MAGHYNYWLVTLSVVTGIIGSYVMLDLAQRLAAAEQRSVPFWIVGGAIAMGLSIWSMHFIGMLAFHVHIPLDYDPLITLASIVPAIAAASLALVVLRAGRQARIPPATTVAVGVIMGLGIAAMHYAGMAAILVEPAITYDPGWVTASIVIAVVGATLGLVVAFGVHRVAAEWSVQYRLAGAFVIGIAIASMHYTGMAAAHFDHTLHPTSAAGSLDAAWLAMFVALGVGSILKMTLAISLFDARLAERNAQMLAAERQARLEHERQARALAREVEERQRAEAAIEQQRQILRQTEKVATMGSLVASLAHELNNPLAVVIGQSGMALREAPDGAGRARIEKVAAAAGRCRAILQRFLGHIRDAPRSIEPLSINQVVVETLDLLSHGLGRDEIRIDVELDPDLPQILGDRVEMGQVVLNLLINAQQALAGRANARITIRSWMEGRPGRSGRAMLAIRDNGPGIPPADRERIWEAFFTTKPAGAGTGLGLYLCRSIVRLHAGSISLSPAADAPDGTEFVIALPVPHALPAQGTAVEPPARAPRALRVLVVDDDVEVSVTLADMLRGMGHEADTAADGAAALACLDAAADGRRPPFDLVLSDIRMPVMDGIALYREIRSRHPHLAGAFALVTGDQLNPEVRQYFGGNRLVVVPKPFLEPDIAAALAALAPGWARPAPNPVPA